MKEPGNDQQALLVKDCRVSDDRGGFGCNVSWKLISYGSYLWRTARESRLLMLLQYVRMSVCVWESEWTLIWLDPSGGWLHWPHAVIMLASEAHVSACEESTVGHLGGIFLFEQIHVLIVLHGLVWELELWTVCFLWCIYTDCLLLQRGDIIFSIF